MATFKQLPSGNWRVQIRRKRSYVSETFRRYRDAEEWALAAERKIDLGETPTKRGHVDPTTLSHLIDLHVDDMKEVNQAPRRSKAFTLDALKEKLGKLRIKDISRERIIQFRARSASLNRSRRPLSRSCSIEFSAWRYSMTITLMAIHPAGEYRQQKCERRRHRTHASSLPRSAVRIVGHYGIRH